MEGLIRGPTRLKAGAIFFDLLCVVLLLAWIGGGIPWGGKTLLRHGADPRRAALLLGGIGAWIFPRLRTESRVLIAAQRIASWLESRRNRWIVLVACASWAVALGIAQAWALRFAMYDVGIFHQILWNLGHGEGFFSTISGAGNFLLDHFSPSLALLLPGFKLLGESPYALPVLHALLVFGAVAAWIFLAERFPGLEKTEQDRLAAATLIFGISFDSLWGNLRWGFHENSLGMAAFSWALALIFSARSEPFSTRRMAGILGCLMVAAGSKEILLLSAGFVLAILAWRERRRGFLAVSLFALSGILWAAFVWFEQLPHPADKNYFLRYYAYLGRTLPEFFSGLLFSPGTVVRTVGATSLLLYAKTLFLPFLFIPCLFLTWLSRGERRAAWPWLLVPLPSIASAALATYPPLRHPGFHYVLEVWPFWVVLCLWGLARLPSRRAQITWLWAFLSLVGLSQDPWGQLRSFVSEGASRGALREALSRIDDQKAVAADELSGTWLAGRKYVTRWPDRMLLPGQCPQYLVLRAGERSKAELAGCGPFVREWEVDDWAGFRGSP